MPPLYWGAAPPVLLPAAAVSRTKGRKKGRDVFTETYREDRRGVLHCFTLFYVFSLTRMLNDAALSELNDKKQRDRTIVEDFTC